MKKRACFRFNNFTGSNLKFTVSNNDLDEDLNFKDSHVYNIKRLTNVKKNKSDSR